MRAVPGLFAARPRRPRSRRPLWPRVARLILAAILLDLLLIAIGLAAGGYELFAAQQSLRGAGGTAAGTSTTSTTSTGTGTGTLAAQAQALRDRMSIAGIGFGLARLCWWPWRPLFGLAAALPPVRAAAQVGPLLDLAADGSATTLRVLDGALPALSALQGGHGAGAGSATDPGARLLAGLTRGQGSLTAALADVTTVERDAATIDTAALPSALRTRLDPALRLLPLAHQGLQAALAGPDLLGANRPRLYLLVPENPLDLRATGGFIGTVALLQADHGRLTLVDQQSSTEVDDNGAKTNRTSYIPPPLPLLTYQHLANLFYRDANWSPDFPTTAALLRYLYGLGQPRHIDGVMAFDSSLVPALLRITGPLTVTDPNPPREVVTLTADNAVATLQARVNNAATGKLNKTFASAVYSAVFKGLRALHGSQLTLAARVVRAALEGRHLLLWVPDPSVAPLLARQRWDGAIDPTRADYLYVVDTNVHYNKINDHVREGLSYHAVVAADRSLRSALAITYANGTTAQNIVKPENNTLYEDFVRVYVPLGSRLIATSGLTQLWAPQRDHDKTVFAGYVRVPSLASVTVTFSYTVPPNALLDPTTYSLTVQKQPGRADLPFQADLRGGASAVRVGAVGPDSWAYQGRLDADLRLTTTIQGGQARPWPLAYDAAPPTIGPGVAPDPWSVLPATLPPAH